MRFHERARACRRIALYGLLRHRAGMPDAALFSAIFPICMSLESSS